MFSASIGITIECHQQRGHIEGRVAGHSNRNRGAVQQTVRKKFAINPKGSTATGQADDPLGGNRHRAGADRNGFLAVQRQPVGTSKRDGQRIPAGVQSLERQHQTTACTRGQVDRRAHSASACHPARCGKQLDAIVAGRPIGIGQFDENLRPVTRSQKLRQAGADDHRIPDNHILACVSQGARTPGHRIDPPGAVELRHVEGLTCGAVGADFYRPFKERHQFLARRTAFRSHHGSVAARADTAGNASRSVNQASVEIADFKPQCTLTEVPGFRIGDFVAGQVENADIHGRNAYESRPSRCETRKRHGDSKVSARCGLLWQVQID